MGRGARINIGEEGGTEISMEIKSAFLPSFLHPPHDAMVLRWRRKVGAFLLDRHSPNQQNK